MKKSNLEIRVGLFVLAALLTVGFLVVAFGRFGELFKTSYQLTLEFERANGIIKNAQVLYRGANVGKVASKPMIADGGNRVDLLVQINSDVEIDRASMFKIDSYGLLGDRFVDVVPPDEPSGEYFEPGDRALGSQAFGIGELTEELQPVIDRMERIIAELDESDVAEEVGRSVAKLNDVLEKMDQVMGEATEGKGAFHMIMNDPEVAEDMKATMQEFRLLSENLRKRGVLFYKDLSQEEDQGKAGRGGQMSPMIRDRLK